MWSLHKSTLFPSLPETLTRVVTSTDLSFFIFFNSSFRTLNKMFWPYPPLRRSSKIHPALFPTLPILCLFSLTPINLHLCCPYALLCVAFLESGQRARATFLKKTDCSSPSNYQLPMTPQLGIELHAHFSSSC